MTTEIRPTPETDALKWRYREFEPFTNTPIFDLAEKLERERDSAKTLNRSLLDQLEVKDAQLEAMREAIKDAHRAICDLRLHVSEDCDPSLANLALAKLKPLLP